ncbi:MAG: zf-TFIIB domain-containing protein [bacterium]
MIFKCKNCGAPLPKTSDRCAYCDTLNDTDLVRLPDAAISDEAATERICPRCNEPMDAFRLSAGKDFVLDRCRTCLGIFFDPSELEDLLKSDNQERGKVDFSRFDVLAEDNTQNDWPVGYIKCPVCREMMNRRSYGPRSGVIVDSCKNHGLWLDGGELGKLLKWERAGGLLKKEEEEKERAAETGSFKIQIASGDYASPFYEGNTSSFDIAQELVVAGMGLLMRLFRGFH